MYRQEDYQSVCDQLRKRIWAVSTAAGVLLALSLASFFIRLPQGVTAALSIAGFFVFIFFFSMYISPLIAYKKHVDYALNGRSRETRGVFVGMEDKPVTREGLLLYPLTINVGEGIRDDGNRLFYYDAHLPLPDWKEGDCLCLTSYDNRITAWQREKKEQDGA